MTAITTLQTDDGRALRILPDPSGTLRFTVMLDAPTGRRAAGVVAYADDGAKRSGWQFEHAGEVICLGFTSRAAAVQVGVKNVEARAARAFRRLTAI